MLLGPFRLRPLVLVDVPFAEANDELVASRRISGYALDDVQGEFGAHLLEETLAGSLAGEGRVRAVGGAVGGLEGEGGELDFHQAGDVGFGGEFDRYGKGLRRA